MDEGISVSIDADKMKEVLSEVYNSLEEKGYNATSQIVGYLLSGDLGYIPSYKKARNKISKLDRAELLESMFVSYLK